MCILCSLSNNMPQPFYDDDNKDHFLSEGQTPEWRPSAYGVLEVDGKILMIKDGRATHGFEFPGGGINMDESFGDALVREFFEETGYRVRVVGEKPVWVDTAYFYSHRHNKFFRSVLLFYRVELTSTVQDTSLVNTIEPNEISKIVWVSKTDLKLSDCHRMIRPCLTNAVL